MPFGEFEDLPIQVGNIVVPCDFVVLDMVEDPYTPLILGIDALKNLGALIDCESETITIRVAQEKVVFSFAKSSKEPMVEQLCSLEIVESVLEEKVAGRNVLVSPVYDEEVFDEDEMVKKNVVLEKEKEIVLVRDDNDDDVDNSDKQTRKRKRVRKEKP